ncbi:MAG: CBS domain-containing protein [Gemmatimonadales bacterium]|nr:MAG: CBS domain-containing protein [Gemmatimonadales bacterium]
MRRVRSLGTGSGPPVPRAGGEAMLIRDVVAHKGSSVVTVEPAITVLEAARVLVQNGIGSAVVVEGQSVVGILTERDVLRLAADDPARLATMQVSECMNSELEVGALTESVNHAMSVMTMRRIRHLPIMDEGRLAGLVSIGDLVNANLTELTDENEWLRDYVQGGG